MKKIHRMAVGFAVVFFAAMFIFSACEDTSTSTSPSNPDKRATSITVTTETATTNVEKQLDYSTDPVDASNKDSVEWTLVNPPADNSVTLSTDGKFKSTKPQVVRVTVSTLNNGTKDITSDPKPITVSDNYVAVTGITDVPTKGTVGIDLPLTGTVGPNNATNKTITSWTLIDPETTGAVLTASVLTFTKVGTVKVKATVANGATATTDYTSPEFLITVIPRSPLTVTPPAAPITANEPNLVMSPNLPGGYTSSFNIEVKNAPIYKSTFIWFLDGEDQTVNGEDGPNFTVPVLRLTKGRHSVTVIAEEKNSGKKYSATYDFKVTL